MSNFLHKDNMSICLCKQYRVGENYYHCFISNDIIDSCYVSNRTSETTYTLPLYIYPDDSNIEKERRANFDEKTWSKINVRVGHSTTPEEVFDYIYGILYSPHYRKQYKEFLKVDFPRIPFPKDQIEFDHYVEYGHKLRELHLMHDVPSKPDIATYPCAGSNEVQKIKWEKEKVYINQDQYFANIPQDVWNFYIGGYQPAQKWLKDRKDQILTYEDIMHYRKIVVILMETIRLMEEIDQ